MDAVQREFPDGEVVVFAASAGETEAVVRTAISDTGLGVPVLLDGIPHSDFCFEVPDGYPSLYRHLLDTIPASWGDAPFPLQVVIDRDGRFAYMAREHDPAAVVAALHRALQ